MNKIIVFYWAPGSCGDIIKNLLNYNNCSFVLSQNGRSLPSNDYKLTELFPWNIKLGWHNRIWTESECIQLIDYQKKEKKRVVIGTHSQEQLFFLKNTLGDQAVTMGITYDKNLYFSVIKNWCKKCAAEDYVFFEIYSKSHTKLSKKFKDTGVYDQFILQEILKHIDNFVPCLVDNIFDYNISLGKIFNKDLSDLAELLEISEISGPFEQWYNLQDPLYCYKFPVNHSYVDILGYNFDACQKNDTPIQLSPLDIVLIRHYCKVNDIKISNNIRTNTDLVNYLNTTIMK